MHEHIAKILATLWARRHGSEIVIGAILADVRLEGAME